MAPAYSLVCLPPLSNVYPSKQATGNLSSERVSKREVFDIFSRHGRLAQISLKQAYGFAQYHTVAEGQEAMDNLQGMDIRGKKISELF